MSNTVGTVIIDVKADTAKLVSGMDKAEKTIKTSINNIKTTILTLATAYAGIEGIRAFKNMIDDSLEAADATGKLAKNLGLTSDSLSEYQYAAKYADISTGELNAGLNALIRRLSNFQRTGGGAAKTAFKELGISADYAREHFTNTDVAFKDILKRLEEMPDGFRKTAIAQDIFSKSASSILRLTSSDLQKFSEEARRIGMSVSQSTADMAGAYYDQIGMIDARMQGLKQTISFSVIAPMDAASKTALEFIDNSFGGDATSKINNFENTAVVAISNIIYSLGFIKDVGTGIELVIDGLELGFYALAGVAALAMQPVVGMINKMIDSYNFLAKKIGKKTIDFKLESSLPDISNKIVSIKDEMFKLTGELNKGRDSSKEFTDKFISNLSKVKESSYETKKSISNIGQESTSNKSIEKQISLNDKLYKQYIDITGTDYDKWALKTSEIIAELGKSTELTTDQFVKLGDELSKSKPLPSLGDYGIKTDNKYADDKIKQDEDKKAAEKDYYDFIDSRMQDQLDMQISLAESAQDWTNSLSGTAGQIADISKAMNAFYVADLKGQKNENKIYNDYGKEFVKLNKQKEDGLISQYELDTKTKKLQQDQDKEIAKTKEATNNAEIRAYADLAGAMASSYEQGSAGAVAFAAVQSALGIASSWTAIANAWAQPFPANIAAAAMVASQVMPIIGQLGGSGGESQSVSYSEQRQSDYETQSEDYEDSMQPVLDRLDRQIDLLESIDGYEGKALAADLEKASEQYIVDMNTASIKDLGLLDTRDNTVTSTYYGSYLDDPRLIESGSFGYSSESYSSGNELDASYESVAESYEAIANELNSYVDNIASVESTNGTIGTFVYGSGIEEDTSTTTLSIDDDLLSQGDNLIKFLIGLNDLDMLSDFGVTEDEYEQIMNDAAEASNEFATSVLDGMQELIDMADDFKNTYDDLTDSNKYYLESLEEANTKVSDQAGDSSLDEYLQEQIDNIALLEDKLSPENIDLLLSDDPNDLIAQMDLTASLSDDLTTALDNGALEALNMKDDIDLLAEAMINSSDNIKSFEDSFKTDDELLSDMASRLNEDNTVEVATTYDELDVLFENLKGGIDGLTDSELEFLNANKDLIDQTQDIYEDVLGGWIDSLEDASQRIQDTADDLRGVSYEPTVDDYYASMAETTSLLNSADYDAFLDSLDNTIGLTSVLKDSSNFNSEQDMEFNQLVAANQFDELDIQTTSELDVLKQIAEDTSASYQAQQDTLDIQTQQANEIVKMRKEIEDLRAEMVA